MVQKETDREAKRRGRPRSYDPKAALGQAIETFWKAGYSGTSLDDLSAATGMNRPSLYAAFGDKHALYLKALHQYWELGFATMRETLSAGQPVAEALMRVYRGAMAIYFSGEGRARGCFAIGTATTEAVEDAAIRNALSQGLRTLDDAFETCLRAAQERGELRSDADPTALAILASATLHTIAIRARAGFPRSELETLAQKAVSVICAKWLG